MSDPAIHPTLSVVSPVYNEADGLAEFVRQVTAVLAPTGISYELILINDGSTDGSLNVATQLAAGDARIRIVSFSRNFGHEAASTAGLRYARGDAAVLIDSDLQDPPACILQMLEKWQGGFHLVYGQRLLRRDEPALKKITSFLFYRLLRRLAKIDLPKDTGDFRLMDRKVVEAFNALPERNRFVRGLICWTGFKSTAVSFERAPRFAGKTKYNYIKLVRLAMDSLTGFTTAPLKIATWIGTAVFAAAMLWIAVVIYQFFFWHNPDGTPYRQPGFTFIYIAILLLGGMQIFLIGLLGEYLARTYQEVQRRPLYIVGDLMGFGATQAVGGPNGGLLPPRATEDHAP